MNTYPTIDLEKTGMNISMAMKAGNITVSEMSEYLGADRTTIYKYKRGAILPSIDNFLAISVKTGVSINDLLATNQEA